MAHCCLTASTWWFGRARRSPSKVPPAAARPRSFASSAGFGRFGEGRWGLPKTARSLSLPQNPYLPIGTLKQVLSYPDPSDRHGDEVCREALEACGLGHLVSRLGETANWSLGLS